MSHFLSSLLSSSWSEPSPTSSHSFHADTDLASIWWRPIVPFGAESHAAHILSMQQSLHVACAQLAGIDEPDFYQRDIDRCERRQQTFCRLSWRLRTRMSGGAVRY